MFCLFEFLNKVLKPYISQRVILCFCIFINRIMRIIGQIGRLPRCQDIFFLELFTRLFFLSKNASLRKQNCIVMCTEFSCHTGMAENAVQADSGYRKHCNQGKDRDRIVDVDRFFIELHHNSGQPAKFQKKCNTDNDHTAGKQLQNLFHDTKQLVCYFVQNSHLSPPCCFVKTCDFKLQV